MNPVTVVNQAGSFKIPYNISASTFLFFEELRTIGKHAEGYRVVLNYGPIPEATDMIRGIRRIPEANRIRFYMRSKPRNDLIQWLIWGMLLDGLYRQRIAYVDAYRKKFNVDPPWKNRADLDADLRTLMQKSGPYFRKMLSQTFYNDFFQMVDHCMKAATQNDL